MKLSFVIPAWNEEKFIKDCIESVLREVKNSPVDTEVIVVNNASTDKTEEIARSFPAVKVVDEPRRGLPSARQAGFLASDGDIIANIDADTILPAGWLKEVIENFKKDDKLVAFTGPFIYYDLSKFKRVLVRNYYYLAYLLHIINHRVLGTGAVLQGGNFVLRRSALEKIGGFDESIKFYGEDADIACRIQKIGRVKFSFRLGIYASGRRLLKEGMVVSAWHYVVNYFWILASGRPYTQKYTYVGDNKIEKKISKMNI